MMRVCAKFTLLAASILTFFALSACNSAGASKAAELSAGGEPATVVAAIASSTTSAQPVTVEESEVRTGFPEKNDVRPDGTATKKKGDAEGGRSRGLSSTRVAVPPTVAIGAPSVTTTTAGPVTFPISYNNATSITLRNRDVALNTTGSVTSSISVSGSGAKSRAITISNITGNGTLGISITPGTAVNAEGNAAVGAGPSLVVWVDNPAPTLAISEPTDAVTNTGPVSFTVSYTNANAISLTAQDITLNSQEGVTGSVTVTGSGLAARTVTIDDITGIGVLDISVAPGTAKNESGEAAAGAGPSASVDVYGPQPTLEPGPGFDGPTPQPPTIGSGPGSDAKAIARWDVVPYQTFDGIFQIGVVAFHINGIDRVEFSLEGGPWIAAIPVMTRNPRTDVVEYWVNLDASLLPDGPIEIRAIAYPTVGIPRVLGGPIDQSSRLLGEYAMCLNSNSAETLNSSEVWIDANHGDDSNGTGTEDNPFRNLWRASKELRDRHGNADGASILCNPGNYVYFRPNGSFLADTSNRWLTVKPAPGVGRAEVVLTDAGGGESNNGLNTNLLHLYNITVTSKLFAGGTSRRLWLDSCHLRDRDSLWSEAWYAQSFATDCLATDMGNTFLGSDLVRNANVIGVNNDTFVGVAVVLNSSVQGQNASGTENHTDIWQPRTILDNIILYGIDASSTDNIEQGIFSRTSEHNDVAIVNCIISGRGYPKQSQWRTQTHHFVLCNNTFIGTPFTFGLSDSIESGLWGSTNILLERNVFQWVNFVDPEGVSPVGPNFDAIVDVAYALDNHFIDQWPDYTSTSGQPVGEPFGTSFTTGQEIPSGVGAPKHRD